MFSTADTIVAIATPPGRGGIGVVRISGPDASRVVRACVTHHAPLEPRRATFTTIAALDQVVVTFFPGPHSYTGEDVVEISAHGSPAVLEQIVCAALRAGARLAEPGEFTLRAFLNGRIDLPQAEAVADLVNAVTPLQARAAFDQLDGTLTERIACIDRALFDLMARLEASVDFPDEGYRFIGREDVGAALGRVSESFVRLLTDRDAGRLIREGAQIAIVGRPNVGKSSIFNALAGASRAIVTEVPGTTRDLVTEVVEIHGVKATIVDTAGQHETSDRVEAIGVDRARRAQAAADLVLVVLDRSRPLDENDRALLESRSARRLVIANKCDLPPAWPAADAIGVSAISGDGIPALRLRMLAALDIDPIRDRPAITNIRHAQLAARARDAVDRARAAIETSGGELSEEFVLADLQEARSALEEIVGRRAPDDLLTHIFSSFCIGK